MTKKKAVAVKRKSLELDANAPEVGSFVLVKGGHEDGKICVAVGVTVNGDVLIADGCRRRVESPKLKSSCHVRVLEASDELKVLIRTNRLSNRQIRRILFHRRDYSAKG